MSDLPAPLVDQDCDCRGLPFMPLEIVRLRESDFTAVSTGDEFKAGVLLWCASWTQVPASSLPDNDRVLSRLAGYSLDRWKRLREGALRGWTKCSDGRLYHPLIADLANAAMAKRRGQTAKANSRWSKERARKSKQINGTGDAVAYADALPLDMPNESNGNAELMQGTGRDKEKENPMGKRKIATASPEPALKRGSRISQDWTLSERGRAHAVAKGLQCIDLTAEAFHNHWLAKSGKDATKLDWEAAWRTWVANDLKFHPPPTSAKPGVTISKITGLPIGPGASGGNIQ